MLGDLPVGLTTLPDLVPQMGDVPSPANNFGFEEIGEFDLTIPEFSLLTADDNVGSFPMDNG